MSDPIARRRGRYATKIGGQHDAPSVTTIVNVLNKPKLPWGAAKETALFAVLNQQEWITLPPHDAIDRLRKHHRGVWDDKANRGTRVHDLACRWAQGETVDCPADCDPYLDALDRFYRDHRPAWLHLERSVIHDAPGESYGGSFDAIADLPGLGGTRLIDLKTGRRFPIETTLQLAGYRYADAMGVYDDDGALIDTEPMPAVDGCSVLYLHDSGGYELLDVPADKAAFEAFLALRRVYGWQRDMEAWERAAPEQVMGLEAEIEGAVT